MSLRLRYIENTCKIAKIQIRRCNHPILRARNIGGYLASTCISTVIEIYSDIIRVSHGFEDCQSLRFIADIARQALKTAIDDITNAESPYLRRMC